jgi:hypothetical protein
MHLSPMPLPPNGPMTAADFASHRPGTVFPAADRAAATYTSQSYHSVGRKGLQLVIDVNTVTGGSTVTVSVLARDPATGAFVTYSEATTAALNAPGQTVLTLRPGLEEDAGVHVPIAVPMEFKIQAVVATDVVNFSVGGTLLP